MVFYDIVSNQIVNSNDTTSPPEHSTTVRYLALPPEETIQQKMARIQSKMRRHTLVWYGRGSTSKHFFNF